MNVESLVGRLRRQVLTGAAARPRTRKVRLRLRFDELEAREVPATLPAPVVGQTTFRSIDNDGWAFSMKADPTNPNQLFGAFVTHAANGTRVAYKFTTNGGTTWSSLGFIENFVDPKHTDGTRFEQVGDPNVAWDRFGNVFVIYTQYHTDTNAGVVCLRKFSMSTGSPVLTSTSILYSWFDSTQAWNPSVAVDTNLASYDDPQTAGPLGHQEDDLAAIQTTANQVRVFVSWNTAVVDPSNGIPGGINPNAIIRRYSVDGGQIFSGSMLANDDSYASGGGPYVFSNTAFTSGRAGEPDSGGRMVTVFSSNTGGPGNAPTIKSDTVSFNQTNGLPGLVQINGTDGDSFLANGNVFLSPGTGIPIGVGPGFAPGTIVDALDDSSAADQDFPVYTEINFTVTPAMANAIGRIDNLSLTIHIDHQSLPQLSARLIAPNGASINLWANRTTRHGDDLGDSIGLQGTTLGGGGAADTTFTDAAFWRINESATPYRGDFRPEYHPGSPFPELTLATGATGQFNNMTAAQMTGTWKLRIQDNRNSSTGSISKALLQIGTGIKNKGGVDRGLANAVSAAANPTGTNHPTKPAAAPVSGVSPAPVVGVDNTLGAFSPHQNRVYVAYSDGGSVKVQYADGIDSAGGMLWNTTPVTAGAGYLPELTVDPTTGTLVLAYYSPRFDAAGARSTMMMQTAINSADFKDRLGTIELSPAAYITPEEQTFDQIRSKVISVEPVPSNGPNASDARMWGNSFGLFAFDGRVNVVYPGNLNITGTQLRTQDIHITAGPRVVGGDMGPILGNASVTPLDWQNHTGTLGTVLFQPGQTVPGTAIPYNLVAPSGGDGRNRFTNFVVTFDRVIDPTSFGPADVKVIFRGPSDDPTGDGTPVDVDSVTPLDDIRDPLDDTPYGSKRFLVHLTTPQTDVGTYSYLIGANTAGGTAQIHDRVRAPILGYLPVSPNGTQTFNYNASPPDQIVDFSGVTTPLTTSITVAGNAFPAGAVIGDVQVRVNITHTDVSDLRLELISPAGQVITLANPGDANIGQNYENTTFADSASQTLQNNFPPYANLTVRPAQPFQALHAANLDGTWQLRITDEKSGDTGVLNDWHLILTAVQPAQTTSDNNFIDQDGDGLENEPAFLNGNNALETPDGFSVPDPTGDVAFELPYKVGSFPVVIPGPRLVASRATGQPQTTDNLVKDTTENAIDVKFDRVINSSTFTPSDVLRIIGPLGDIPLNGVKITPITALNGTVTTGNSQFFRIEFAQQKLSGTYSIQLSSDIADTDGNQLDTNTNAGVGNLLGTVTDADVVPVLYGGVLGADVTIPAHATVAVNLSVADSYQLKRALAHFTILNQDPNNPLHTRNLEGRLVAPDGTTVLLFQNAPEDGNDTLGFQDTTLDDAATTPVQLGGGGFPAPGTFNPVQPLAQLIDHTSKGIWKLVISNKGDQVGLVHKFALTFDKPVIGTGLGEEVGDQTTVSFRISQTDGGVTTAKGNWTPVGPAPQFQIDDDPTAAQIAGHLQDRASSTSGRISSVAVDPSDPSGNTVYAAGASGGVWRTTNFLTRDVNGPTWVPLTDFGPNNAINVGSLAVFNRTGDPNKTFVLVGTGSDDLNNLAKSEYREDYGDQNAPGVQEHRYDGVGYLLSEDAGKTWQVLDSTNNFDVVTNIFRPFTDAARDHLFVGSVINRLVFETDVDAASTRPVIYAAVGKGDPAIPAANSAAGLWRSRDGGRTWVRLTLPATGDVTDFVFGQGSQLPNSNGRPTFGYVAIKGSGVYFTSDLDSDNPSFSLMAGGVGRPTVNQGGVATGVAETPNGNFGKIVLATPALDSSALANNYYQRWLYVAEANADGTFRGLYMTKDRGLNWTKVKLTGSGGPTIGGFNAFGFSDVGPDVDLTMYDPVTQQGWQGGNHALTLAVDPNDPNIVYFGSDALVKIDTTLINDPYNLSLYNHSNADGGLTRPDTAGGATDIGPAVGGGLNAFDFSFLPPLASTTPGTGNYNSELTAGARRKKWNHLNLDRDPYNPFRTDTHISVSNTSQFNNTGGDVRWVLPGGALANGDFDFDWVSQVITFRDPMTGQARIIFGHDEGITSYVSQASGSPEQVNGFNQDFQIQADTARHQDFQITAKRNGNLQTARLFSGDANPSLLAADISNALLFGAARRVGDAQRSQKDPQGTGSDDWKSDGRQGRANYVAADQTGDGTFYILRRINDLSIKTNFFQVSLNGNAPISRTNGLFQNDTTDPTGFGQWDNTVRTFAVNPIDGDGIIMGSAVGRLFRTRDQGLNWNHIAEPGTLDGSYLTALAFGAPQPNSTNLNDFIYAGSTNGHIFVTVTGGGDLANSWFRLDGPGSNGTLDGSPIMKIVANPVRGTHELFAVTRNGIFHGTYDVQVDVNNVPTGVINLVWQDITTNIKTITAAAFGNTSWQVPILSAKDPIMTIAVDWRPVYGQTQAQPILYVGGDGGVFRATYNADLTTWARYTGPANGSSSDGGGLPIVKVTDLDLALGNIDPNTGKVIPSASPDALVATTLGRGAWTIAIDVPEGFSGPFVQSFSPNTPQFQPISSVNITFNTFITASSFTTSDVTITGPNGQSITPTAVVDITNPPPNQPNLHNQWRIDFPSLNSDGTYTITVGPDVRSGVVQMDQDRDAINGEPIQDRFVMKVVIGLNDLADYVKDTFQSLLNRLPTTAEFTAATITNMSTARFAALGVVVKELLSTAFTSEARYRLVERLFNNGGAAGEIGNVLPTYTPTQAEKDFYINALKNGTKSPELILGDIIATTDATKGFKDAYFNAAGGTAQGFLDRLYSDLFRDSAGNPYVQFAWLPQTTRTNQLNTAATPSGRLSLTRNLIAGTVVKYFPGGNTNQPLASTDFRSNFVQLAYQKFLGRAATPTEVTAGKSLMARPLAAASVQGSEWLYWKLLSGQEYFNRIPAQADGLPDDGLHTDRGWVQAVINDRMYRTSAPGEEDDFSRKVLDRFKTQRAAFVNSIVQSSTALGMEYRDLEITKYFQLAHARNPTDTERANAQTALKNGATFQSLISARFATSEFYQTNAPQFAGGTASNTTWAKAVYLRLFNRLPNPTEQANLASQGGTVSTRQAAVLALLNSAGYREILITARFQTFFNRVPNGPELVAYKNFLATHRWEGLITDLLANGAANPTVTGGLPRQFWEVVN